MSIAERSRDVFQNSRYVFRGVPERSEHLGAERVPGTFGIRFCDVPGSLGRPQACRLTFCNGSANGPTLRATGSFPLEPRETK